MIADSSRVRRFRLSDLPDLMRIERTSFGPDAYPRELFVRYRERGALFLVAETDAGIAGYALVTVRSRGAELVSIAVRAQSRRHGVGAALVGSVLRRLRRAGVERLSLMVKESNRGALRFYEGLGFTRVRRARRYYEDGADGYLMRRSV